MGPVTGVIDSVLGGGGGNGGLLGAAEGAASQRFLQMIARDLFESTDPLRKGLIGQSEEFVLGDFDARDTAQFRAASAATGRQFQTASRGITETLPAGGALLEALANLQANKARTLVGIEGNIEQQQFNRAIALATGQPLTQAVSAAGGAANIAGQQQIAATQADAAQNAAAIEALGTGVGAFLGGKG